MFNRENNPHVIMMKTRDGRELTLAERNDEELMLLARGGYLEAFDEIVSRHQERLLRVASKYLGGPDAARDAVQAAFLDVYRALSRYRGEDRFKAYLHRALINRCRMTHRSRTRFSQALGRMKEEPTLGTAFPLPDEQLLAHEQRRDVEMALNQLGAKHREVLLLRYSGELSYQEIADTLGIRLGTVKSRLFDGLVRLRNQLS